MSVTEFCKSSTAKDGFANLCKPCKKEYDRQYVAKNKDRLDKQKSDYRKTPEAKALKAKYDKEYRDRNKKKIYDRQKKWVKENKERIKKQRKEYYRANKAKKAQYDEDYRKNNYDKRRVYEQKRRATKLNNGTFKILDKEIKRLYDSPCAWCHSQDDITADHLVPLARGGAHSIGNLIPLCRSCNSSKGSMLWIEFVRYNVPV